MAVSARFARVFITSLVLLGGCALVSRIAGSTSAVGRLDSALRGLPVAAAASPEPWTKPVPKAECGKGDRIETGLQGQTTVAERFSGASAKAYNCNLELIGQFQGEGASWQMAVFDKCAYYDTANRPEQQHKGVVVVDVSDPRHPVASAYLEARSMWDPWESLKVNVPRKLLAAVQSDGGRGEQPGFAVYDISDCRHPVLKSSVDLAAAVKGHAGHFSPDGRTYYGAQFRVGTYPIDVGNPSEPKLLGVYPGQDGLGMPHDLSLNAAGDRLYTAQAGGQIAGGTMLSNGLVITDVSDLQARRPNAQPKVVSTLFWKDGTIAQMTERVQINGHPYVIFTDESGSGGVREGAKAACAQSLPPFGFARIIDIADEKNPKIVSKLMLEVDDPANCATVQPDEGFADIFGYSSHYCTPDNPQNARYLACSYFEAGLRVFDIRDPYHPKEIAYYKPPATGSTMLPGSSKLSSLRPNRATDWTSSNIGWRRSGDELHLWFTSHDNGFQVVKFTNRLASLGKSATQS